MAGAREQVKTEICKNKNEASDFIKKNVHNLSGHAIEIDDSSYTVTTALSTPGRGRFRSVI